MLTWKVLLIDDDEDDYLLTREMLAQAHGRTVKLTWVSTYEQARAEIVRGGYDVILVDYDLGSFNGLDLTREVMADHPELPVILLTGRGSYEVDLEAMQAGASLYLTKDEVNSLLLERSIRYAIERKQASEALRASEERFRQLADSMPQLVWTAKPDGEVDYYNRRYREFDGIQHPEGPDGRWEWSPVLHPDDAEKTLAAWNRAIADGSIYQVEHRVRLANGGYRWFLSRGIPARDAKGRVVRWFGTATDIHDQKLTEESSRSRERLFRQLIAVLPMAVYTCDARGRINFYNPHAVKLWGRAPAGEGSDACLGTEHIRDVNGQLIPADQTPIAEVFRTRSAVRNRRFIIERSDGSFRLVKADIEPLFNANGDLTGVINVLQDMTEESDGPVVPPPPKPQERGATG